jgi:hypothetical protein
MKIDTIELTINAVEHGTAFTPIDLIVVDDIDPIRDPRDEGGHRRDWRATQDLGRLDTAPVGSQSPCVCLYASPPCRHPCSAVKTARAA